MYERFLPEDIAISSVYPALYTYDRFFGHTNLHTRS